MSFFTTMIPKIVLIVRRSDSGVNRNCGGRAPAVAEGEPSGPPRGAPVSLGVKLETLGFPSCARLPGTRRPGLLAALPPALDRRQSGGLIDTIAGDCPLHMETQLRPPLTHREGLSEH